MPGLLVVTRTAYYPDCSGGAELSTHTLLRGLQSRGWRVEVLCRHAPRNPLLRQASLQELRRQRRPSRLVRDNSLGYPCSRVLVDRNGEREWTRHLVTRLGDLRPDIVMSFQDPGCPLLERASGAGHSCLYHAHNLAAVECAVPIPDRIHVVANAPFTASRLRAATGRPVSVVLEMIDATRYRVAVRQPTFVTVINPIPEKGLVIALDVARSLPGERFLFVKGRWLNMSDDRIDALLAPARELPNLEILEHQDDMRSVYAATDILLVPSQFTETFGRVIVEAQLNGIPVVASDVGGISYVLGRGGILIRPGNDTLAFVDALRRLRADAGLRSRLAEAALANSQRPEFDPEVQIDEFIRLASRCCKGENRGAAATGASSDRAAARTTEKRR